MSQSRGQSRVCPTRIDERPVLFTHKVSLTQCQDRQRGRYHKCFTCVYNNAWASSQVSSRKATPSPQKASEASPVGTGAVAAAR